MIYQDFFINRTSNTSADTLVALGWADLMQRALSLLGKSSEKIVINNSGPFFEVKLPFAVSEEELVSEKTLPLLDPLISAKQDARQAKKGRILQDGFDYDGQSEKQKQLIEQLKQLPPALRTPEARLHKTPELEALLSAGPRPELAHYKAINILKVADTFNEMVLRWRNLTASQQWQVVGLLCRFFSTKVNDLEAAETGWEKLSKEHHLAGKMAVTSMTAVQVINPITGKGSNASKSNRLSVGGLDSFWLLELLKFKGFMLGAAPYQIKSSKDRATKDRRKDRKTYVVLPEKVELGTLTTLMNQFREICWSSTALKQDILASLRLAQVLVEHRRQEYTSRQEAKPWRPAPLISQVQGFDITSYKDMGSAHATINIATINIPNWFPELTGLPQLESLDLLLREHIRVIRRIEGYQGKEGNDELELLQAYRNFLSGHDLQPFWWFAARYGNYLFRQREREKEVKRWLPQLTKKGLDQLLMHQQQQPEERMRTIMQTPGFQHIASAIREATVRAQRRASQENDHRYDIRYGLHQDLLRKARLRDDFMTELGKFIALYNAETAREEEKLAKRLNNKRLTADDYRTHHLRFPVTTGDLEQFGTLLDTYPSELVATMLVAYGTSRLEPFKKEEVDSSENASSDLDAQEDVE